METDPHHKEIRWLSLTSSIVFLAQLGLFVLIVAFHYEHVGLLLIGSGRGIVFFAPLAVAVVFIVRLVYLRFTANALIPFVDGWLIQLSILSLYIGMFIIL
jgi:uncharacterized membrane protein (DUF485 family)